MHTPCSLSGKNNTIFNLNSSLPILLGVLIVYFALTATVYQHARFTADSTLYINIAQKYLNGNLKDAINGYWGPMLSWLLIPFLYFGSSHVFAVNALDLIIGVFTIFGVWLLSYRFGISEKIRGVILISLLPIVLFISLIEPFDFLLFCLIVYYLVIIFKDEYPSKIYNAVFCGILGAFAYFTKSYAFPFFIAHFTLMNIAHYIRCAEKKDKRNVLRNAIAGIVIFLIICSPWILLISNKYNHFTISNMGKGNFANKAPGLPWTGKGFEFGGPVFYEGFFAPPNETAISVWENPSYIWEGRESWSPLDSFDNFKYFIKHCIKNLIEGMRIYQSFSRLSIAIIFAYILLIIPPFNKQMLRGDILYPFFTLVLYTGGYVPFHFEARYLWLVNILLLLMGGYVVNLLLKNEFFNSNSRKNILIFLFALSFIITPLKSFAQAGKNNINNEMYVLGMELKSKYNIQGNIASNREGGAISTHEAWHKTFRLAYWLNSKYYGQARESISDEELESELKKYDIDYYFFWGEPGNVPQFLSYYRELTNGEIPNLRIYLLKENR